MSITWDGFAQRLLSQIARSSNNHYEPHENGDGGKVLEISVGPDPQAPQGAICARAWSGVDGQGRQAALAEAAPIRALTTSPGFSPWVGSDLLQRHRIVSLQRELHDQMAITRRLDYLHVSGLEGAELLIEVPRQWV
jgi:hypothetical protein